MDESRRGKVANSTSLTAILLMVFSGALLLFLIGLYFFIGLHSENIVTYMKEHTAIVFEIGEDSEDGNALISEMRKDDRLRPESIEYITSDEGLTFMQEELGADLLPDEMENPFSDLIISYVKVAHTDTEELDQLRSDWVKSKGIQDVYFQNDYLQFWDVWKGRIFRFTAYATLILLFITVMLIFNTVKLTVFLKKKSIEILELVGASWPFIQGPFIRNAIKMGLISALLASIFIAMLLSFVVWQNPFLVDYFNWYYMVLTILVLILFGVVLQYVSTRIVLSRMLKGTIEHLES